ncbi:MAG: penicillin acylase family protein, partial [Planctomycetes bacterium]|nr:penicillin acylase family protein [Planctomycetota bacterium]
MKGDAIDFFIEDCRRGGSSGWQYRRGRKWHDFSLRQEVIQRKDNEPITIPVYENEQGILDGDPNEQ